MGRTELARQLSSIYCQASQPDEGKIVFNGQNLNGLRPSQICKLGMTRTFQIVKPFPELTVLENVMIGAFNKTGSTKHAKEIALDVLELVEFSDQAKMSAGALPVAGRKRIEVAKALATQPELLLLDEVLWTPTAAENDCGAWRRNHDSDR